MFIINIIPTNFVLYAFIMPIKYAYENNQIIDTTKVNYFLGLQPVKSSK